MKQILTISILTIFLFGCMNNSHSPNNTFLPRVEIPYNTSGSIANLYVLPAAFSKESIKNYPRFIEQQKQQGFGNAIWNELEDLLYDTGYFKLLSASPATIPGLSDILEAKGISKSKIDLPEKILTINTNFFIRKSQSMNMLKVTKQEMYHVTVYMKYFELDKNAINIAIPASGDAVHSDLLYATKQALKLATKKLLRRINAKKI